jgi:DNA invertase Pin-like site-specific DNA recombinase
MPEIANNSSMPRPTVTVIPATVQREVLPGQAVAKKRVATYARVSTDEDEQLNSYEAQVSYYTQHIKNNPKWEFVEVYADEAVSGTSTKRRKDFNRMFADALAGKIDLILTKSISRFARNTVDTLTTVRQLKEKGVEVYFEKENIYTMDSKGEILITIMSSLAQEESRSISENVTWGQRRRMAEGKINMPYGRFLGYQRGADNVPEIVESEAAVVRQIYTAFLEGYTYREIARQLTEQGIPTPGGKQEWASTTIRSILTNEKYAGNAILQKQFTVDFLTKKTKVNEGEVPQYFVENSHPAIVSPEIFEEIQGEIQRRKSYGKQLSGSGLFFAKIHCGECNNFYGAKLWHAKDKYRRTVWQCNAKYGEKKHCPTPHLTEEAIKDSFVKAFNLLLENKAQYITEYEATIQNLTNLSAIDRQIFEAEAESSEALGSVQLYVDENAHVAKDQDEYEKQYALLAKRYEAAKARLDALKAERQASIATAQKLRRFVGTLRDTEASIAGFDASLWRGMVETVTVCTDGSMDYNFKSGTRIRVVG